MFVTLKLQFLKIEFSCLCIRCSDLIGSSWFLLSSTYLQGFFFPLLIFRGVFVFIYKCLLCNCLALADLTFNYSVLSIRGSKENCISELCIALFIARASAHHPFQCGFSIITLLYLRIGSLISYIFFSSILFITAFLLVFSNIY